MVLDIRGLGLKPTPVFKRYIERRLRHALRAFDIDRITVRLIRGHGLGRRATHRCQVAVSSHGLESLRVNETHGSIHAACARATSRTRRILGRLVQRARRHSRATRDTPIWHDLGVAQPFATHHPIILRRSRVEPRVVRVSEGVGHVARSRCALLGLTIKKESCHEPFRKALGDYPGRRIR